MRTLIVGAGAVGGYYGAKLARAGHDVVFTARGRNLKVIRDRGLRLESVEGPIVVSPARALETPRGEATFELVLICVKAQHTEAALAELRGAVGASTLVLSLQNGVESEELIERSLGISPMVRGLAYVGVELVGPGTVRHSSGGTVVIGEPHDRPSSRLRRLAELLREASIEVVVPESIVRAKWQKLAWNASFNIICALTGVTIGAALADSKSRRLVETAMREVEAVAEAQGIEFDPDHIPKMLQYAERIGFVRPSTLQDREKGKSLEHDALTGAVVRYGERFGVPTPVNQTLDGLARLVSSASGCKS
jgi:2-dehydropantoate 2-reductase